MAYDTFLYVDQKNGSDLNSGLTVGSALATITKAIEISDADVTAEKYTIFVLGGEFSENFPTGTFGVYGYRLVFLFGAKLVGTGVENGLRVRNGNAGAFEIYNADISNYLTVINNGNGSGGYNSPLVSYYNCKFRDGGAYLERGGETKFYNCEFKNVDFTYTTNGTQAVTAISVLDNCDVVNCNDLFVAGTQDTPFSAKKSLIKDSTVTFCQTGYSDTIYLDNVLENTQVRFTAQDNPDDATESYLLVSDATEMQAKADADLGAGVITINPDDFYFDTIDFLDETNDNLFLASKNIYQYNSDNSKRHIGANRYAIYVDSTKMNPDANSTVSGGFATRVNSNESEIICDAIEFPQAQIIRRAYAIVDVGNGGEIMSSQTEDVNKRIIDVDLSISVTKTAAQLDASPEAYENFKIGIVDTALNYDNINKVAKSVKPKFTIKNEGVSTDFGEVKVYQIIIETEDVLTFENYTDYELKQIAGNAQNCKDYTGSGDWIAPNEVNINPNNDIQVQALIDLYSGVTAGTTEFTVDAIMAMNAASGGDLTGVFAETLGVAGISGDDLQTQYARTETAAGTPEKIIHTFDIL